MFNDVGKVKVKDFNKMISFSLESNISLCDAFMVYVHNHNKRV